MENKFNLRLLYWDTCGEIFDAREGKFHRMIRGYIFANLFGRSYFFNKFNWHDGELSHATLEFITSTGK